MRSISDNDGGDIRWDADRESRTGVPEIIYGPGKSVEHLLGLFADSADVRVATLLSKVQIDALAGVASVYPRARIAVKNPRPARSNSLVAIVSAGTADISVAEESAVVLTALGFRTLCVYDVGVAGLHRLLRVLPQLRDAAVCIVIAGMDGALVSVVGGLVRAPVIAVPTSVGTGVAAGGIAALHTMLASCSPGVAVVNIDNGVGAALVAVKILNCAEGLRSSDSEVVTGASGMRLALDEGTDQPGQPA